MSNLKIILKYNFLQSFNKLVKNLNGKKKRSNLALGIILGVLGVLIYAFLLLYIFLFSTLFIQTSKKDGVILIVVVIMSLLTFTSTLTKANSSLFRMKDYDLLNSLPIKGKDILISKLISLIGLNPIISLLVGMGTIVIYSLFNSVSVLFWVLSPLIFLILPIIPIIIGCFVSYIFGFIPIKQKSKNLLATLLYVGFLLVVMMFSFSISSTDEMDMINKMEDMYNTLEKVYFLAPTVVSGILGNVSSALIFSGISVILLVAFIAIVSLNFNRIVGYYNKKGDNVKYKYDVKQYKKSSALKALFKKELIHYFNTPNYIMNTIVGPIMSIILTVVFTSNIIAPSSSQGAIDSTYDLFTIILIPIYLFAFGLTTTTASTFSLEGKGYWIIKSSPVSYKDVFLSKVLLNLLVTIPFLVVDIILLFVLTEFNVVNILLVGLVILIFIIFNSLLGLFLSIKKHDFNIEPIKAIKNSMSVLISMLVTFLLLFVEGFVSIILFINLGMLVSLLLTVLLNVILLVIMIFILLSDGVKTFNNIEV